MNILDCTTAEKNISPVHKNIQNNKNDKKVTAASIAGSAIGIAAAVAGVYQLAKNSNPEISLKNLAYSEGDVILIGAGSVLGGLTGGLIADKNKENVQAKKREAMQQFFGNMLCPIGLLSVCDKLLDAFPVKMKQVPASAKGAKYINTLLNALPKALVTVTALVGGMEIGNKIMNKVNNKIFKEEVKHEVQAEDYLVHADDLCLTANMLLKDSPSVSAVTSKILPATFLIAGSKTGTQKA